MKEYIEERAVAIANYIIDHNDAAARVADVRVFWDKIVLSLQYKLLLF